MKKKYIKPVIECIDMDMSESFMAASVAGNNSKAATNAECIVYEDDLEDVTDEDETWNNIIGL